MGGLTNFLKSDLLKTYFRNNGKFYLVLLTDATVPDADTNKMADVTEIAEGNGYSKGGIKLTGNATDFPVLIEDNVNDKGVIGLRALILTASGGSIPKSGDPARYALLTGPGSNISNRKALCHYDLVADKVAVNGQEIQIPASKIELIESV